MVRGIPNVQEHITHVLSSASKSDVPSPRTLRRYLSFASSAELLQLLHCPTLGMPSYSPPCPPSDCQPSALIADIWDAKERGAALAMFTVAPFAGPAIGPIVGGYLYQAGVSWRWLFWILTLFVSNIVNVSIGETKLDSRLGVAYCRSCSPCLRLTSKCISISETLDNFVDQLPCFRPVLLMRKAKELRKSTGDDRYHAAMELQSVSFIERLENVVARPFKILFLEPMLIAITLYISVSNGISIIMSTGSTLQVCLWLHIPAIRGLSGGFHGRTPFEIWRIKSHVFAGACWRHHRGCNGKPKFRRSYTA
jgi:MFS family permease